MADRLEATGVLLVGGGSERFGSPKALAPFRGEALGERGWRVLREACAEVIAVGKAADGLDLPFPLHDDGVEERAPVFGVLAGLRAASHDTCLLLPVDCPLVTPDLLRELLAERAVPQTGPLPGVYTKGMRATLEERVVAGELSLRGVNTRVLELDERQLANVNTPADLVETALADWARERPDVRAAVVVGSRARDDSPADRWSDLDAFLVVDDAQPFLSDDGWVSEFGAPVLTFVEATPIGGAHERRVLYESGADADLALVPLSSLDRVDDVGPLLARGYRVLLDELGIEEALRSAAAGSRAIGAPSQAELTELASDFWYHALWAAKKLRRGEVFTAIGCVDGHLKQVLATLLGWHARAVEPGLDTWHAGRFVERWADPGALATLERSYAHYDLRDLARALWETVDLFQGLEEETARRLGLATELDHVHLRRRLAEVVPDAHRRSLQGR